MITEYAARQIAVGEDLRLQRQETARAVTQVHDWQAVLDRDIKRANDLRDRVRIPRAALHAGVIGMDDDLAPVDDADAADDPGTRHLAVIGLVGGKRGEFEERRTGIEQQFYAVADEHLVLALEPLDVACGPVSTGCVLAFLQRGYQPTIVRGV